ncbi:hypothetical protein KUCAC02_033528, partial [Chaenocephalus aceratus]
QMSLAESHLEAPRRERPNRVLRAWCVRGGRRRLVSRTSRLALLLLSERSTFVLGMDLCLHAAMFCFHQNVENIFVSLIFRPGTFNASVAQDGALEPKCLLSSDERRRSEKLESVQETECTGPNTGGRLSPPLTWSPSPPLILSPSPPLT